MDREALRFVTLPPGCGYADAGCQYVAGLHRLGVPVCWTPMADNGVLVDKARSQADLPEAIRDQVSPLWERSLDCSALLLDMPPLGWHAAWLRTQPNLRPYAYVAWEVDSLPKDWPAALSAYDRVFVPSEFNRQTFVAGGVTSPVDVVPHVARGILPVHGGPSWGSINDDDFVFYTVGPWSMRKAMEDTIRAYLETFSASEKVALIVKTEGLDQIACHSLPHEILSQAAPQVATTWWSVARIISDYDNPAKVHLISDTISPREIDRLHTRGDCFLSLTHGEGWGLNVFDAALFGNPVVVTGWGGQLDYLGADYPLLVRYELEATSKSLSDGSFPRNEEEHWARADRSHAASLMRSVFEDRRWADDLARSLAPELQARFAPSPVCQRLATLMGLPVPTT